MLEHSIERGLFFLGFLNLEVILFLLLVHFLNNFALFLGLDLLLNECLLLLELFLKTSDLLEESDLECEELNPKSVGVSCNRKSQLIEITSGAKINLVEEFKHDRSAVAEFIFTFFLV